jgi:hypothetical protein
MGRYGFGFESKAAIVAIAAMVLVTLLYTDSLLPDRDNIGQPVNLSPAKKVSIPRKIARSEAGDRLRANLAGDPGKQRISSGAEKLVEMVGEPALRLMFKRLAKATSSSSMTIEIKYRYGYYPVEAGEWKNALLWEGLEDMAFSMGFDEMVTALRRGEQPVVTAVEKGGEDRLRLEGYPALYVSGGIDKEEIEKIVAGAKAYWALHMCLYPSQIPRMKVENYRGASEDVITRFAKENLERCLEQECSKWRGEDQVTWEVRGKLDELKGVLDSHSPSDWEFRREARRLLCEIVQTDYDAKRDEYLERQRLGFRTWVWGSAEEAKRRARGEDPRNMPQGPW